MNAKAEVNKMFREHANEIARKAARLLGISAPVCARVSRRRGFGRPGRFSIPQWAFQAHPSYREYYIVHEVCHAVPGHAGHHGPAFRVNEARVLESFGIRLAFPKGRNYPDVIRDLATGADVCDNFGRPL